MIRSIVQEAKTSPTVRWLVVVLVAAFVLAFALAVVAVGRGIRKAHHQGQAERRIADALRRADRTTVDPGELP